MRLTEDQITHFFREGYVIVNGLISQSILTEALSAADACLQKNMKEHLSHGQNDKSWHPACFNPDDFDNDDAILHRITTDSSLGEVAVQLLGDEPRLLMGMLAFVPPRGQGLPWHQDNMYFHIFNALNIFVAVSPIKQNMGTLWVSPGSHLHGVAAAHKASGDTLNPGHLEADVQPDNAIQMPDLEPGDACIFDRSTLHHSGDNESDSPRYAYAVQLCANTARSGDTGERVERHTLSDVRALLQNHECPS
jgi:hypothetical protein